MKVLINASPLIFLSKMGLLNVLELYECYTTSHVINEVFRGIEEGHKEALDVKALVDRRLLRIINIKRPRRAYGLHPGEFTIIAAAKKLKIDRIIVDDYAAIKVAKYYGLKPMSTPFVLLAAVKNNKLTKKQFRTALDDLISFNYRISPPLYQRILELAEKLGRER